MSVCHAEGLEDKWRRTQIGSLKKKALNASNKLTHFLKKRGKWKVDFWVTTVLIEDVRDAEEERKVYAFRIFVGSGTNNECSGCQARRCFGAEECKGNPKGAIFSIGW